MLNMRFYYSDLHVFFPGIFLPLTARSLAQYPCNLICTNQKYLLFRITLLIEHRENQVKPVVPVDKHSVHPKAVPFN